MVSPTIERKIHEELGRLSSTLQQQVLEYARQLAERQTGGIPGREHTQFAGFINAQALDLMADVIERDCERIDENGW
jgi:hypothetical protein